MTTPRVGFSGMLAVLAVALAVWWLIPRLADRWEPADFAVHYRTPASLSQDYWQYRRFARQAAAADEILLVGDSVVWGEYVDAGQTLADHLTQASGRGAVFRNGGLNGLHPLAMEGLHLSGLAAAPPHLAALQPALADLPRTRSSSGRTGFLQPFRPRAAVHTTDPRVRSGARRPLVGHGGTRLDVASVGAALPRATPRRTGFAALEPGASLRVAPSAQRRAAVL